ncbi:helix-turn-helix domain-containing protein [Flavobacterium psychrotrophum]|uniref:helix-turn-helix domain-containing protein n=1 Tax=Flavobacterium psychrotrophum TaxID=2294119 RepID=UPI000E30BA4F|nr:helix-turn-helix transcriptional regulator [Flavobacterium psychrotrophum]
MAEFIGLSKLYGHVAGLHPDENNTGTGHFNILNVEDLIINGKPKSSSYSRRSFYKVSLIEGKCIVHYADRSIAVDGCALVFTNPSVPYKWEVIGERQFGNVCVFTESFLDKPGILMGFSVFQSADNAVVLLTQEQYIFFKRLFEKMREELHGDYVLKYDYLRHKLLEVIHEAQKLQPEKGEALPVSNGAARIALLFNDLLERQFTIEDPGDVVLLKTPSDFAAKLNVHVNHLNKSLREILGLSTSQLIRNRVLQEARVLLKTTSWTVAEISGCLGFEESNHFSTFFKKTTNLSPLQFRKGD